MKSKSDTNSKPIRRTNGRGTIRDYRNNQKRWIFRDAAGKTLAQGICRTKSQAEKAIDKISTALQNNHLPDPQKLTVRQFAHQWLDSLEIRPTTRAMYAQELGYALTTLGWMQIQKVHPLHVNQAMEIVSKYIPKSERESKDPRTLCGRTVRMVRGRLKAMFDAAVRLKIIAENPTVGLNKLKATAKPLKMRGTALNFDQAKRFFTLGELLHEAGQCRLWAALHVAISVGLRRGEVMGLQWEDIDFDDNVIHIRQNLTQLNGQPLISKTKTQESERDIPMMPELKKILERHRIEQNLERQTAKSHWNDTGFVFATELGKLTHPACLYRTLQSLLSWSDATLLCPTQTVRTRKDGSPLHYSRIMNVPAAYREALTALIESAPPLPKLRPHDMRHTAATLLLRLDVPIEIVSKILGHSKVSITMDVYRQVEMSEKRSKMVDLSAANRSR